MGDLNQRLIGPVDQIVGLMGKYASFYIFVFMRFAIGMNFKQGKTEALFRFSGPGAVRGEKALFNKGQGHTLRLSVSGSS